MKQMTKLLCLLMICMLLPLTAGAAYVVDETTFNKTCKWRMTSSSTLYREIREEVDGEMVSTYEPIGTLSAGKYIVWMYEEDGKINVRYWNGGEKSGWIDDGTYARYTRTIYSTGGWSASIPALAYGDEAAVRYILSEFCTEEEIQSFIDGMNQGLVGEKDENGQIVIVKQEPLEPPTITLTLSEGETAEVEMVLPGVANSTVLLEGEEVIVPTADLAWVLDGAEHALAVIYAPRSGIASLYARDEGDGGVIKKFKTGSVVLVLGQSGKYTKVYGEGTVGYVITSALTFCDPCPDATQTVMLRKANLRLAAQSNGRKLIELPKDAAVTLIGVEGKWAQVEYQGFVGYVEKNKLEK